MRAAAFDPRLRSDPGSAPWLVELMSGAFRGRPLAEYRRTELPARHEYPSYAERRPR